MWSPQHKKVAPSAPSEEGGEKRRAEEPAAAAASPARTAFNADVEEQEQLIDLTDYHASMDDGDDEENQDFISDSLRSFVEAANARLQQERQGFLADVRPNTAETPDLGEEVTPLPDPSFPSSDAWLSPQVGPGPAAPAATDRTAPHATPAAAAGDPLASAPGGTRSAATPLSEEPKAATPVVLFASPDPEPPTRAVEPPSPPDHDLSHIGDLDETQLSIPEAGFDIEDEVVEIINVVSPRAGSAEFGEPTGASETAAAETSTEQTAVGEGEVRRESSSRTSIAASPRHEPGSRSEVPQDAPAPTEASGEGDSWGYTHSKLLKTAEKHMQSFLIDYNPTPEMASFEAPARPSPAAANGGPVASPSLAGRQNHGITASVENVSNDASRSHKGPSPKPAAKPTPASSERLGQTTSARKARTPEPRPTKSTQQSPGQSQKPSAAIEEAQVPAIQPSTEKKTVSPALLARLAQPTISSKSKNERTQQESVISPVVKVTSSAEKASEQKSSPVSASLLERLTQPTEALKAKRPEHTGHASSKAPLAENSKTSDTAPVVAAVTAPLNNQSPLSLVERLSQPTVASRAKEHEHVEYHTAPNHSTKASPPIGLSKRELSADKGRSTLPLMDRLMQPTAASMAKEQELIEHHPAPEHSTSTLVADNVIDLEMRVLSAENRRSSIPIIERLAQPTAASKAKEHEHIGSPQTSIQQYMELENELSSPIPMASSPMQLGDHHSTAVSAAVPHFNAGKDSKSKQSGGILKRDDTAVSKGRSVPCTTGHLPGAAASKSDRSRLSVKYSYPDGKSKQKNQNEISGQEKENKSKMNSQLQHRTSSTRTRSDSVRRLTVPKTPKFATTAKLGASRIAKRDSLSEVTLAQSTDVLRKGLRVQSSTLRSRLPPSGRARSLTIPVTPKFVTTVKYGEKKTKKEDGPSLAQSTAVLAKGLREASPAWMASSVRKLTTPVSPKFHTSVKRREPPPAIDRKTPAIAKRLSYSSARLQSLSVPRQSSSNRYARDQEGAATTATQNMSFKARPMPNFSKTVDVLRKSTVKPTTTVAQPFHLSTGRKKKETVEIVDVAATEMEEGRPFRARPVPTTTYAPQRLPSSANGSSSSSMEATKPFKLESERRHELYQAKLEAKRKEQEEQERLQRQFQAREFKCPPQPEMRVKADKPPTTPKPFQLASLNRHEAFESEMKQKLAAEEEELRRQSNFKAKSVPKSTYEPTMSPSHTEEWIRQRTAQEEVEQREIRFQAKPVPKSTYTFTPISPKYALRSKGSVVTNESNA